MGTPDFNLFEFMGWESTNIVLNYIESMGRGSLGVRKGRYTSRSAGARMLWLRHVWRKVTRGHAQSFVPGCPITLCAGKCSFKTPFLYCSHVTQIGRIFRWAVAHGWRLAVNFRLEQGSQLVMCEIGSRGFPRQESTTLTPVQRSFSH